MLRDRLLMTTDQRNNTARAEYFAVLQTFTAELLADPEVQQGVGEDAIALRGLVQKAYSLPLANLTAVLPVRQALKNNVGVIIEPEGQRLSYDGSRYFGSPSPRELRRSVFAGFEGILSVGSSRNAIRLDKSQCGAMFSSEHSEPRQAILLGGDTTAQPAVVQAGILAHEIDHALFERQMMSRDASFSRRPRVEQNVLRERRAYNVGYMIMERGGIFDELPDPGTAVDLSGSQIEELHDALVQVGGMAAAATYVARAIFCNFSGEGETVTQDEIELLYTAVQGITEC